MGGSPWRDMPVASTALKLRRKPSFERGADMTGGACIDRGGDGVDPVPGVITAFPSRERDSRTRDDVRFRGFDAECCLISRASSITSRA